MRVIPVILLMLATLTPFAHAANGRLFNISASGNHGNANFTLCLDGVNALSCQNFSVSSLNLNIKTTIPKHTYNNAGIKINAGTPLDRITGFTCKQLSNGYCIFSLSDTTPVNINLSIPDYLIIGAGTAGSVLARKLSDDNITNVVVLHNGPNLNQDPLITLSENAVITVLDGLVGAPLYATGITTPQPNADDRNLMWIYALPFGGASSVNASAYCRGTNQVYSQWESINGANWSTTRILNSFIELENYTGLTINPNDRGYNGLLPVRQVSTISPMSLNAFLPALQSALPDIPLVVDYNDPSVSNAIDPRMQYTQMGVNGSLRASSAIAFLNNTVMDTNGNGVNGRRLHVIFNVTANNIIWQDNKAIGVTYYGNGQLKKIYANKGVIVTAGIKSSAFLMRSGVGPKALLQSLNIPVVYDNPNVGQNLKDQFHLIFIYQTDPADSPSTPLLTLSSSILTALAQTNLGQQLLHYIGSEVAAQNGLFFQIAWLPAVGSSADSPRAFRFAAINPIPGFAVVLFDLLQPQSSGSIVINSANPFVEPTMDLGVFTNSNDLDLYFNAVKVYMGNFTSQLSLVNPLYQLVYPDPSIFIDDNSLRSFILSDVNTDMHFQGHCKMAPLNQGGVVDNTGHVYGVQNLIVADDSIVPVGTDGSPMATAYMIADNIANILLQH